MKAEITLKQFSGPLDLLLSLVDDEKLDISEIALSNVTEQFMSYLDTLEEHRVEQLADFLVVAARLLLLKSRLLLPQFALEVDDGGPKLEDQLRLYKQFVEVSKKVQALWVGNNHGFMRIEPRRKPDGFSPPANLTLDALRERMVQLITRLTPPKPLPKTEIDRTISLKQKIDDIRRLLKSGGGLRFHHIMAQAKNKTEVIVSFLALLELVKQKTVSLTQSELFGDIVIEQV